MQIKFKNYLAIKRIISMFTLLIYLINFVCFPVSVSVNVKYTEK